MDQSRSGPVEEVTAAIDINCCPWPSCSLPGMLAQGIGASPWPLGDFWPRPSHSGKLLGNIYRVFLVACFWHLEGDESKKSPPRAKCALRAASLLAYQLPNTPQTGFARINSHTLHLLAASNPAAFHPPGRIPVNVTIPGGTILPHPPQKPQNPNPEGLNLNIILHLNVHWVFLKELCWFYLHF